MFACACACAYMSVRGVRGRSERESVCDGTETLCQGGPFVHCNAMSDRPALTRTRWLHGVHVVWLHALVHTNNTAALMRCRKQLATAPQHDVWPKLHCSTPQQSTTAPPPRSATQPQSWRAHVSTGATLRHLRHRILQNRRQPQ